MALGRSLGAAIRAADAGRVLVVASGGLSHWLPSNDPRDSSVPAERRAAMIHGRRDVRAFAAAREPRVRALGGNPDAPVNAAWDTWFLKQLVTADLDPVTALGDEGLEERAGSGGHEIRTWLIGFAAVGAAARLDELRAGAGMDHRHGHRHHLRGGLMPFAVPRSRAGCPGHDGADRLAAARATGRPCRPVRTLLPAGDVGAAYAVQAAWVAAPGRGRGQRRRPQDRPDQPGRAGPARRRPARLRHAAVRR